MQAWDNSGIISKDFEEILNSALPPGQILKQLLPLVTQALQADRCFLYLRNPEKEKGRIEFCWCRNSTIPYIREPEWKNDTQTLPQEDPLFAAALQAKPSVYVEDIETADPYMLNRDFEEKTFGHRALVHAHITYNGQLWGILQPAVFGSSRTWSSADHQLIESLLPRMIAPVIKYVQSLSM